jgi:hypothetical protein
MFIGLVLVRIPLVVAQTDCTRIDQMQQVDQVSRLKALHTNNCLGGANDQADLTREIVAILQEPGSRGVKGVSDAERRLAASVALEKIQTATDKDLAATEGPERFDGQQRLKALREALLIAHEGVVKAHETEGLHRPGHWEFERNTGCFSKLTLMGQGAICLFDDFVIPNCREPRSSLCSATYARAKAILRYDRLIQRALNYYSRPIVDQHYADAVRRDRQWDAYFNEARFQYMWELKLNGLWLERNEKREMDAAGNRLGFREPPTDQWIVLHPNVGMEYIEGAPDGNQLQEAVFMEILGYNRWSWKPDGRMGTAVGASIIGAYSDRATLDDWRYGVMLHYNNTWSLAVTRRNGETGFLLSMDFAQFLADVPQKARNALRSGK